MKCASRKEVAKFYGLEEIEEGKIYWAKWRKSKGHFWSKQANRMEDEWEEGPRLPECRLGSRLPPISSWKAEMGNGW